jgi:hypothetical protein
MIASNNASAADLAAHLDAVAVGHAHVEDRDVGPQRRDAGDRLCCVRGLADDGDVTGGLEQGAHTLAHHLVVVHQKGGNGPVHLSQWTTAVHSSQVTKVLMHGGRRSIDGSVPLQPWATSTQRC